MAVAGQSRQLTPSTPVIKNLKFLEAVKFVAIDLVQRKGELRFTQSKDQGLRHIIPFQSDGTVF